MQRHANIPGMAEAVGPFSQAVVANGFVFVSGQIPAGRGGINDQPEDFESKVRRTLENLRTVLEAAGTDLDHVVKCNGYLTRPEQLEAYNRVYTEFFANSRPARTTVGVNLWGVDLEIDCMAVLPGADS